MNGVFAIKKPVGPTSQDVVGRLKRLFTHSPEYLNELKSQPPQKFKGKKAKRTQWIKIGHGGTLDPLASGVLVLGVGSGTKKLQSYLGNCSKTYVATCLFGCSTTTYDSQGAVLGRSNVEHLTDEQVQKALGKFAGKIKQCPPVFSALKMDGMPLYEYARKGIKLPRPIEPRECEISYLKASELKWDHDYMFPDKPASESERNFAKEVTGDDLPQDEKVTQGPILDIEFSVSSGTYIRSLIHDLGRELGVQAHMVKLTRETQGDWELGKNVLPLELFDCAHDVWWPLLDTVLKEGPKRDISEELEKVQPTIEAAVHKENDSEEFSTNGEKNAE